MKKILIATLVLFVILIIVPIIVWNFAYVDEAITTGERHGLVIGEEKNEVFNRIKTSSVSEGWVAVQVGRTAKDFKVISLAELKLSDVVDRKSFVVMYDVDDSYLNTLKLNFESNRLSSMHRHKQIFELP